MTPTAPNMSDVWMFRFVLEREDGRPMSSSVPEQLLEMIVSWAEEQGYQIGGGYGMPKESDWEDLK